MKKFWSAYRKWRHSKRKEENSSWKNTVNAESKKSFWEFTHSQQQDVIQLLFVPHDNYSSSNVRLLLTPEQFEDLMELCQKLKSEEPVK
jgi:FtsZ-interacting cell division protein YlmF